MQVSHFDFQAWISRSKVWDRHWPEKYPPHLFFPNRAPKLVDGAIHNDQREQNGKSDGVNASPKIGTRIFDFIHGVERILNRRTFAKKLSG